MKQETHKAPCGAAKALNRCRQEEAEQSAAPCKMDRELQGSNFHESSPLVEGMKTYTGSGVCIFKDIFLFRNT